MTHQATYFLYDSLSIQKNDRLLAIVEQAQSLCSLS